MAPAPIAAAWPGLIQAYREFLPVEPASEVVTLLEGNTPLLEAPRLARAISGGDSLRLYLKCEGLNPTGSFKDRGMTVAITQAVSRGAEAVICASTGNTSASAAAYSARAGLQCLVLIPHGAIAMGKLSQALIHGACVVAIRGNFDDALRLVREVSHVRPVAVVNSINPDRIQGQKTAAFEICDWLGDAPAFHCIPVGNAGNITAYWLGYQEYHRLGRAARLPRMLGFQAAGAAPIVRGEPVSAPETIATAIRIGNPASWQPAVAARDESGGTIDAVTDEEILAAYRMLAAEVGVFCEPASAASVAGLRKLWNAGYFAGVPEEERIVVCTLTGHGLKDPATVLGAIDEPVPVPATCEAVLAAARL
ncbi:MAG: threonine synthase [Armatimonadota bacterium]